MAPALRALTASINVPQFVAYALFGAPVVAGLALTLAPAFGYLPALGGRQLSLAPWRVLFDDPGFWSAIRLTLFVGFSATAISLALAFAGLSAGAHRWAVLLPPLLATPHSAMAIGLAFLLAPSGWLMRLASPWATGFLTPPDIATVNDPFGFSLILGLVLKETPFLVAASLAALARLPSAEHLSAARALGYRPAAAWLLIVAPQLYKQIRLPLYTTLAYSLSVVDMALVLASSHPGPLSLLGLRWFLSPDLALIFPAAAAATLQLLLVIAAMGVWRIGERLAALGLRFRVETGRRGALLEATARAVALLTKLALALALLSLAALGLWSLAWRWPFPRALPESWSLQIWREQIPQLVQPLLDTLSLASVSTCVALALAVAWLEADDRAGRKSDLTAIYLPLLAPQLAFLFGVETLFAWARLDGGFAAVAWAHSLFVFPYVLLAMADPWRALDRRYARAAMALGASKNRVLLRVKLPILASPLAFAFALGVSVSVAQYLSTLFAGGGRIATLTTEALSRASGGDRRVAAVAAFLQAAVPLIAFGLDALTPRRLGSPRGARP
jgi:putative thiamine transport system permease protein